MWILFYVFRHQSFEKQNQLWESDSEAVKYLHVLSVLAKLVCVDNSEDLWKTSKLYELQFCQWQGEIFLLIMNHSKSPFFLPSLPNPSFILFGKVVTELVHLGYLSFSFLFNISLAFTDSGLFHFLTVLSEIKSVENCPLSALIFGDTVGKSWKEVPESLCCVCLFPEQRINRIFSSILVWEKLFLIEALELDYVLSEFE